MASDDAALRRAAGNRLSDAQVERLVAAGSMDPGVLGQLVDMPEVNVAALFAALLQAPPEGLQSVVVDLPAAGVHPPGASVSSLPAGFHAYWPAGRDAAPPVASVPLPPPPEGRPVLWPTRGRNAAGLAIGGAAVSAAEAQERARWSTRAVAILEQADLPVVDVARMPLGVRGIRKLLSWLSHAGLGRFRRGPAALAWALSLRSCTSGEISAGRGRSCALSRSAAASRTTSRSLAPRWSGGGWRTLRPRGRPAHAEGPGVPGQPRRRPRGLVVDEGRPHYKRVAAWVRL